MSKPTEHTCKDCKAEGRRGPVLDAPFPGPRCYTHNRKFKREQRVRNHDRYVQRTYGLPPGVYQKLYEAQGGRCWICQKATGKTKRLAVDHDHSCCAGPEACGLCVRGLLCGPCNTDLIGRYGITALSRAIAYLTWPPAHEILAQQNPTEES